MSPVFSPPTMVDVPQVLEYDPDRQTNPLGYRLMRHFKARTRGINVYKMSDGTYVTSDSVPGVQSGPEPYPATTKDMVPNGVLAASWYKGQYTVDLPLPSPYVQAVYYGGHSYTVTAAEAAALTAAGYGSYLA